jgi:Tol biopolymer transport system component
MYNSVIRSADLFIAELNGNFRLLYDSAGYSFNPIWSPDGTRIVFQERDLDWYSLINVVNADGSDLRPITYTKSVFFDPAWSPDGAYLALHEGRSRDIVLLDMQRGGLHTLTPLLSYKLYGDALYAYNGSPSWSPDSRRIAFDSDTSRGMWQPRGFWVYIMNADGMHTYVIDHGYRPAWRPPRKSLFPFS